MSNITLAKKLLRSKMRESISRLSEYNKQCESEQMIQLIVEFINSNPNIKTVASYAATKNELNLDLLPASLPKIQFCYPKCEPNGIMQFHIVDELAGMLARTMGIREPDPKLHQQITADSIDLFICPAFAYSEDGKRLGKGGGYYDRYLCNKRIDAMTLGIVFKCQKITHHIPTEEHDLLIDRIL